jgi:hypothetical protein
MPRLIAPAVLASCLLMSGVARADTVTITGGALTAVGVFGATSFNVTGDGFSAAGGNEPGGVGPSRSPRRWRSGAPPKATWRTSRRRLFPRPDRSRDRAHLPRRRSRPTDET